MYEIEVKLELILLALTWAISKFSSEESIKYVYHIRL